LKTKAARSENMKRNENMKCERNGVKMSAKISSKAAKMKTMAGERNDNENNGNNEKQ